MEGTLNISISGATTKSEDKTNESVGREEEYCSEVAFKEDEVESTKAEMTEVREENARLKMLLQKIENDYKSLQMCLIDTPQQETKASSEANVTNEEIEEPELVSLCLGRSGSQSKKDRSSSSPSKIRGEDLNEGLKLGLNYNFEDSNKSENARLNANSSPENSVSETKEEEAGETWPPSKVLKAMRSGDDDLSQTSVKRARVSVRARCDTPTMNDGCQWRKYGQKIAKGNPCPRAYYRCTVAPSCPVRKQVQRCAEDMSILITTYEGTHNHPLPVSATAMASTTSAAASMLLSGSSSSHPAGLGSAAATNLRSSFHGLNVNLSDNSKARPFYLSSSSPPFPTITLDLTTTPSTSSAHISMFSTTFQSAPRFPSTSLSFSPSQPSGNLNYGSLPYNKAHIRSLQLGRPSEEHLYLQNNFQAMPQQALTETLTKAITSDPSFRSVIAAAISTMVGPGGSPAQANNEENFAKDLKWDEQAKVALPTSLTSTGKGYAPNYLNQSS